MFFLDYKTHVMKSFEFIPVFLFLSFITTAQNVGIGTLSPLHRLHIVGDSMSAPETLVVTSSDSIGALAIEGNSLNGIGAWFRGREFGLRSEAKTLFEVGSEAHIAGAFEATGSTLKNEGVNGFAFGDGAILNRGVTGSAAGGQQNYGIFGSAQGTGSNYGIYGNALGGAENWAGFFEGDAHVSKRLGVGTESPVAGLHAEGTPFSIFGRVNMPLANPFDAHIAGVFEASGSTLKNEGLNGLASGNGAIINRGVTGSATGDQQCYGLFGSAQGTGTNYGVYGSAIGGSENWAGFFSGQTKIESNAIHLRIYENSTNDWGRIRFENSGTTNFWDLAGRPDTSNETASFAIWYQGLGTDVLFLKGDGNATLAGTLMQNSDLRLKTAIRPINTKFADIEQIRGYTYQWKNEARDQSLQTGFIAQEVAEVFPELVDENDEGTLSVNYIGFIPHLLEVIKSQEKRINDLEKKVAALSKNY